VRSRIASLAPADVVGAPLSVSVQLADELDVARGSLIVRPGEEPQSSREISATLCWLGEAASVPRGRYLLKHMTTTVRAVLDTIHHTLEVERLEERPDADSLSRNEIGRVTLRVSDELFFDPYLVNRATGSFILIDEATNETVGAGMIDG
jgi:sulfate adenylyltransferase subunit 1 (EFTu-like GTPase family)